MFSDYLLTQIELKKIQLHDLAKGIRADIDEVESWINDETLPSYVRIIELTQFFQVPISYWFSGHQNISESMSMKEEMNFLRDENLGLKKKVNELETDLLELIKQYNRLDKIEYLKNL